MRAVPSVPTAANEMRASYQAFGRKKRQKCADSSDSSGCLSGSGAKRARKEMNCWTGEDGRDGFALPLNSAHVFFVSIPFSPPLLPCFLFFSLASAAMLSFPSGLLSLLSFRVPSVSPAACDVSSRRAIL